MSAIGETPQENYCFTFEDAAKFTITWAPRAIFAALAGYYCLGIAYEIGLMAAIDQIAIRVLKHYVGYAGIGAAMPTFQWYSAWAVRFAAAIIGGIIYDLAERIVLFVCQSCFSFHPFSQSNYEGSSI